jgi:hypothetical protein
MNPGATIRPVALIRRRASAASIGVRDTAAIRSPVIATSAR